LQVKKNRWHDAFYNSEGLNSEGLIGTDIITSITALNTV